MAPKKRREGGSPEDDVFTVEAEGGKPAEPEKVVLEDATALKRALDDAVCQAVSEAGHDVDHTSTDLKIALGLGACAVACLAQFYPRKYPDNAWVLAACVVAYCILSGLMTVVAMFEADAIAVTKGRPGGPPAFAVSSKLPRFEETYSLRVAPKGSPAPAEGAADPAGVSLSRSVGTYFYEDGQLAGDVVRRDVQQLLAQFLEAKTK